MKTQEKLNLKKMSVFVYVCLWVLVNAGGNKSILDVELQFIIILYIHFLGHRLVHTMHVAIIIYGF